MSSASGRLYLHLGPPKTGTTSLQIAAQAADLPWLVYGGTSQPRELNRGDLARGLHAVASGDVTPDSDDGHHTRVQIEEVLSSGRHLLVSEEMFLVTQRKATFQDKISSLAAFLTGIPVSIVLTLREPEKALPSYYQEIYYSLPLKERLSFAAFCRADRAQCFDYAALQSQLLQHGFSDIRFLTFEDITSGFVSFATLFGCDTEGGAGFEIGAHNVGAKGERTGGRVLPPVTFRTVLAGSWLKHLVTFDFVKTSTVYRWLSARLTRISLIPGRERHLEVPRDLSERLGAAFARLSIIASSQVSIEQQSRGLGMPRNMHSVSE